MTDLTTLRAELDAIDDALHDLLMRRAAVVQRVGMRKAGSRWRPGREAAILRRLLARHQGPFPRMALIQVWRGLLAGSLAQQGAFTVAAPEALADLARARFGMDVSLLPGEDAIAALRGGQAAVALIPWPGWRDRLWRRIEPFHVVARLPWWDGATPEALAVTAAPPDPSGDDHTLLALPAGASWTGATRLAEDGECCLLDVRAWIAPDDPVLSGWGSRARVVGAYAAALPVCP